MSNALKDIARISYRSIIPLSASNDFIEKELYKMMTMQTSVFMVHMSHFLGTHLFLKAKEIGMLSEVGNQGREVAIWRQSYGISKELNENETKTYFSRPKENFDAIIWPGGSTNVPKGWGFPVSGKKLRIAVPRGFNQFVKVEIDPHTNATIFGGFCIEIFKSVISALPYAVQYEFVLFEIVDGSSFLSYNDMVYQVSLKEREKIVSNLARLVMTVWLFVVLILSSSYTASLSSRLTVQKLRPTVTDVNELIKNGDYVGYRSGSFIADILKDMGFDKSKITPCKSRDECNEAISKGSKNGGMSALFGVAPYNKLFVSRYCGKYTTIGPIYRTGGFGFASLTMLGIMKILS
ncbi:unnamed protein product [Camellia sinensis]